MDTTPEDETSYTTQYQEAFLKYMGNEYCDKHRGVPVNKPERLPSRKFVQSATASGSCQSSFDPHDLCCDDEEYLTPNYVAEMTAGSNDRASRLLTASRLYSNCPPEAPMNWGQINPNLNDYHSDPVEISSTFCLPDITDWWRQEQKTHTKYADLSNVARDIFCIIPRGVAAVASFSHSRDVIGRRQLNTTGRTFHKTVILKRFDRANTSILAGIIPVSDTMNTEHDFQTKKEAEERTLHRMPKVHDFLEMWHGSLNLRATQMESRARNKQMTAIGYI